MRAKKEETDWLLKLSNGSLNTLHIGNYPNIIEIPDETECNIVDAESDIIDQVFLDMSDPIKLSRSIILAATNEETLKINKIVIERLPGNKVVYLSADKACCDTEE